MQYNTPHLASPKGGYSRIVPRALLIRALATSKHELALKLTYDCFLFLPELECTLRYKTVQHYLFGHCSISWV